MKVERPALSTDEIRAKSEAWFARQVELLSQCHGRDWPKHQAWIEGYLKQELRGRLIALGWSPKA